VKITHISDVAGIGSTLTKYQRLSGDEANLFARSNLNDKYGIYDFYRSSITYCPDAEFITRCIRDATTSEVIHIHGSIYMLTKMRAHFGPRKKIILHYHGTDLRGRKKTLLPTRSIIRDPINYVKFLYRRIFNNHLHSQAQKRSDAVLVSTKDLLTLVPTAVHSPTPVDTEHFTPDNLSKYNEDNLMITNEVTDAQKALDYCSKNRIQIPIDVYDRTKNPILYTDMPKFLKRYGTYMDVRFINGNLVDALSATGLQALACGLKVLDYRLKYLTSLPKEHYAPMVVSFLRKIYNNL
jgi:hypothetical protein